MGRIEACVAAPTPAGRTTGHRLTKVPPRQTSVGRHPAWTPCWGVPVAMALPDRHGWNRKCERCDRKRSGNVLPHLEPPCSGLALPAAHTACWLS